MMRKGRKKEEKKRKRQKEKKTNETYNDAWRWSQISYDYCDTCSLQSLIITRAT